MTMAFDTLQVRPRFAPVPRARVASSGQNALLGALGQAGETLTPYLRTVALRTGDVLHDAGEPARYVDFPLAGVAGVLAWPDEDAMDAALVGRDGALAVVEALTGVAVFAPIVVRQPGAAARVDAARLRDITDREPALRASLSAWAARLHRELQAGVACAASHRLEGRLATWLLRCHERSGAEVLAVRQEELARALGVQRTSVNAAAQGLQAAGALRTARGRVAIDEAALKRRACACHGI